MTTHADGPIEKETRQGVTIYRIRPANLYWVGHKDSYSLAPRILWQVIDTWNPLVYRRVKRILAEIQPDIVHVHKLRGLSPAVWQAARSAGVQAVVQTCHDYELISPVGTLEGRIGEWARRGHPLLRPYQSLRARASRAVGFVTAPSRYLLDTIRARGLFPAAQAHVIPNFHDVPADRIREAAQFPRGGRRPTRLAFLGRLEPNKGISVLLGAIKRVSGQYKLIVAGWGSEEAEVRRAASEDPRIRFVGTIQGEQRRRFLAEADALVVPSTWEETFGMVVVEALARGTPVLASRIGALPSLVQEGVTGRLFDPNDEVALAKLMQRAVNRPEELSAMQPACLIAAREFTLERVSSRYVELYAEALNRPRATQ